MISARLLTTTTAGLAALDEFLHLLAALVADLLVELMAVFLAGGLSALRADLLVKRGAVALAGGLPAFLAYVLVKPVAVSLAGGFSSPLPSFAYRHRALFLLSR